VRRLQRRLTWVMVVALLVGGLIVGPLALLPTQAQGVASAVASDVSSEADCKVRCGIRAGGEWYCEIECSWQF